MQIGLGLGIGMSGAAGGGTASTSFSQSSAVDIAATALGVADFSQTSNVEAVASLPTLASAQLRFKLSTASITLGGTMRPGGTSPSAVTLTAGTGSLTYATGCPGLRVECDSVAGGTARGQATFRISYDSGATWAHSGVLTAATYSIPDGVAVGNVVNFPAGTYGTNQTWEGTAATIVTADGFTYTQATAATQPVFRHADSTLDSKVAGHASLFHVASGAGQWIASTDAAAVALFANDPALTVFGRIQYTVADLNSCWLSACNSASNDLKQRYFRQSSTGTGRENHVVINDAGTTISNVCTTDPLTGGAAAHTVCWFFPGSNGGANIEVNGGAEALTIATLNAGTVTPNRVVIGSIGDSAPTVGMGGHIYDIPVFSRVLSPAERAAWVTELAA